MMLWKTLKSLLFLFYSYQPLALLPKPKDKVDTPDPASLQASRLFKMVRPSIHYLRGQLLRLGKYRRK